ncbi:hypothetical protein ACHAXT_000091 [Thalassiosira profunda]
MLLIMPSPTASSPTAPPVVHRPVTPADPLLLDAFDFDDGLPHIVADHDMEVVDHLASNDAEQGPAWDGKCDVVAGAAADGGGQDRLDVVSLFNEDIGEWPMDAQNPPPPPQMQKVQDGCVAAMVFSGGVAEGVKGRRAKPRIKLSLKGRKAGREAPAEHTPKDVEEEEKAQGSAIDLWGAVPLQKRGRGRPKKKRGSSKYLGVSRRTERNNNKVKYEVKLHKIRVGIYTLETDAALASDGLMRAIMRETSRVNMYSEKINFQREEDYKKAREEEMIARDLEDDMESALQIITQKVEKGLERARDKGLLTTC